VAKREALYPPFEELELIRREGGLAVQRFATRLGIQRSTWYQGVYATDAVLVAADGSTHTGIAAIKVAYQLARNWRRSISFSVLFRAETRRRSLKRRRLALRLR
jgi:hypothetical protein